jgi:hypothetical protein
LPKVRREPDLLGCPQGCGNTASSEPEDHTPDMWLTSCSVRRRAMTLITLVTLVSISVILAVGMTRTILSVVFLFITRGIALSNAIPITRGTDRYEAPRVERLVSPAV